MALGWSDSASAHCDSVDGLVVMAAQAALDASDVKAILPYEKAEAEAELTAAFEQTMAMRAHGGEAQEMAGRKFFETAVRLYRACEGATYTGLKEGDEADPALEAAEAALESGSLDGVYQALDDSIRAGVLEHYQAVLDAREHEAGEGTVGAARARVEAELEFELYIHGLGQAAHGPVGHEEGATGGTDAPVETDGHSGQENRTPSIACLSDGCWELCRRFERSEGTGYYGVAYCLPAFNRWLDGPGVR
jgi:hypothetical protein